MIITGRNDLRHLIEMNRNNVSVRIYLLDKPTVVMAMPVHHLMNPLKSYEQPDLWRFEEAPPMKAITPDIVVYNLWGYDTDNGTFVFRQGEVR